MNNKPIIILGGGPTGLAAAYKLSQMGKHFILIEKEKYLGGLSVTRQCKKYLYEYGPHAFHLKDKNIIDWLKNILGDDFRIIPTNTQVFIDGKLLTYPLRAGELFRKVSPILGFKIIFDYLWENFKKLFSNHEWQNFQEWGIANLGKTLYKMSFGDYTAKVWGMNPNKLSVKLATNKLSKLNLREIIAKTIGFKGKEQPLFFKKYLYPKKGMAAIFSRMSETIENGGEIFLDSKVVHLKTKNHQVVAVTFEKNGAKKEIACGQVISTFPIKQLAGMINDSLDKKTVLAADKLNYRDLIIVYVAVAEKDLPDSQWIYLVENKFKFNRVSINKNLSPDFSVNGKTLLAFEICCQKGDELWNKQDNQLLEMTKDDMDKLGWSNLGIKDYFVKRLTNAYPIYLVDFEKNVSVALKGISEIDNLHTTGRNGLFLNSDINDCFQMGFAAAEKIEKIE